MKKEIETRLFTASKKLTDYTVIIEVEGKTITSKERGVKPVLALVEKGEDISGAVVADRVVGKAVALLYKGLKISALYAGVISRPALSVLENAGVLCKYDGLVDMIINRKGDGRCPMEEAVLDIDDYEQAVRAIKRKLAHITEGK